MEFHNKSAAKKQRNQKERRKIQEKYVESPTPPAPGVNNAGFEPQPQRTNRRQRNEQTLNNNPTQLPAPAVQEKRGEVKNVEVEKNVENVVIDHSHLKRETEEIAKLKNKSRYAKRDIASNWHRYSASEGITVPGETEEGAPADFSELLQVPLSRGGHLQLKEEQDWSTASGGELNGYFALDLQLLNQSLACVPLYEELRLPKHIFTEEEIRHFDVVADQAKKCYNADQIEDPNKTVLKLLTNLVHNEVDFEESPNIVDVNKTEKFNILDIEYSKEMLTNIEPENCFDKQLKNSSNIIKNNFSDINTIDLCMKPETLGDKVTLENNRNIVEPNKNKVLSVENCSVLNQNPSEIVGEISEKQLIIKSHERQFDNKSQENIVKTDKNSLVEQPLLLIDANNSENGICIRKELQLETTVDKNGIQHNDINKDNINSMEIKEKRTKRSANKKSPVREVNTEKLPVKPKDITLEDDDDLDFLLSLKKPVPSKTQIESKPTPPFKDSTFLPAEAARTEPQVQKEHSELDDWLDSVLED